MEEEEPKFELKENGMESEDVIVISDEEEGSSKMDEEEEERDEDYESYSSEDEEMDETDGSDVGSLDFDVESLGEGILNPSYHIGQALPSGLSAEQGFHFPLGNEFGPISGGLQEDDSFYEFVLQVQTYNFIFILFGLILYFILFSK